MVLGDRGIVDQGSWQNIIVKAESIAKFASGHTSKENVVLSANYSKFSAQLRAKDETELDLARQTGDAALYGSFPLSYSLATKDGLTNTQDII